MTHRQTHALKFELLGLPKIKKKKPVKSNLFLTHSVLFSLIKRVGSVNWLGLHWKPLNCPHLNLMKPPEWRPEQWRDPIREPDSDSTLSRFQQFQGRLTWETEETCLQLFIFLFCLKKSGWQLFSSYLSIFWFWHRFYGNSSLVTCTFLFPTSAVNPNRNPQQNRFQI